jgi:uncharacterized protein YukE
MSLVAATPEELDKAHSVGRGIEAQVKGLITQVNNQVDALLPRFKGMAAGALIVQHSEWNTVMVKLSEELNRVLTAIKTSADKQRELEHNAQTVINRAR